jgi:hypothetical protein
VSDFHYVPIIQTLNAHGVRYVLIGGLAAIAWGSDHITSDIDVCYDRERQNVTRLVAALRELDAHLRGFPDGVPEIIDERAFKLGDTMTFATKYGWLDCLGVPAGTGGYKRDDLAARGEKPAGE